MTTPTGPSTYDSGGEAFAPEQLAEVHEDAGTALDRVSAAAADELKQADYGTPAEPENGS